MYMILSRDRNTGRSHNIKIDNKFFEIMEQFKYFGTNLTDQNSIHGEINCRYKLGNACSNSMQNFFLLVCYQK
jgi:hypothetical protein